MIGTSRAEYLFIRLCIFCLHSLAPLCVCYCFGNLALHLLNGPTYRVSQAVEILAVAETCFYLFIYLPYSRYLQADAVHPPAPSREGRRDLFVRCVANVKEPEAYLSKWFMGARLEDIQKDNLKEFFLWAFWNRGGEPGEDDEELEEYVRDTEKLLGREIKEGRGKAVPLRLTLDPVDMLHRSLTWYFCIGLLDLITHIILKFNGFHFYRTSLSQFFNVFPVRPQMLLTSHRSPAEHISYWYREHTSKDKLPILFIHGIGIGLFTYTEFMTELNSISGIQNTDPNDQVGIIAIEILPISSRITHRPLDRTQMCNEIDQILQNHFPSSQKFVLLSHSYGSVVSTHLLKFSPSIQPRIAAVMLVDPVTILLHLPDVAYNFTRRKPKSANEYQLYYFASMDMGVSHTLGRHFFWSENLLWIEDLKGKNATVCLAERDLIVNTAAVGKYLTEGMVDAGTSRETSQESNGTLRKRNIDIAKHDKNEKVDLVKEDGEEWKSRPWKGTGLDILWFKGLDHAQVFDSRESRARLFHALRGYCENA